MKETFKNGIPLTHEGVSTFLKLFFKGKTINGVAIDKGEMLHRYTEGVLESAGRCYICKGKAEVLGCFMPGDSEVFGAPKGKTRFLFYGLCIADMSQENADKVEDDFLNHVQSLN